MRQLLVGSVSLVLLSGLLVGCGRKKNDTSNDQPEAVAQPNIDVAKPVGKLDAGDNKITKKNGGPAKLVPIAALDSDKQEKYEAALASALTALAERKWEGALAGFQAARAIQDNDFVREEIAELERRADRDESARTAVKNIEVVLKEGRADEAARLAKQALLLYGDSDAAARLAQLRVQAEAVLGLEKKEDPVARYGRYRKEGETALAEKNLRAAVLAFEIALQSRDDDDLRKIYNEASGRLERYDALRLKAAELRRDPVQIDGAIDALKEAAAAWDTPQVRAELDDALLAQEKRRDTVGVADFTVPNAVVAPGAGSAIADDLLPLLRAKYDLVRRDQLRQALADLKLERGLPDDAQQRQQVGKLANVRYVVVGRIHALAVVGVYAKLIDLQTGLVVQTGKVQAPTVDEAVKLLPDLAKQLLLSDREKMKLDQDAQRDAANLPNPAPDNAPVPPAPAKNAPPPPPMVMVNAAPPGVALVKQGMFAKFGPAPDGLFMPPPLDQKLSNRFVLAAVELGDFLFRSGQFADALRKYQFAALLAPDDPEIQTRLRRSRLYAPTEPVPPIGYVKPRIAVLTFAAYGDPYVVPPALCFWTPANLAPYYSSRFDVVDPAEITWFMAKTGLNMMDLVTDANKLRWLGRAVDVRNFVFGSHVQSANFDVNAYLVDAELGFLKGTGRITVQDVNELKLRLPELAALTMMDPGVQAIYVAQQQQFNGLILQGLGLMNSGAYDRAVPVFQTAVALRPDSVQARIYLLQAQNGVLANAIQMQRQQQYQAQMATLALAKQQQRQFVLASDQARLNALAYAAGRSGADRQADLQLRMQARSALVARGQVALNGNRFGLSLALFQGAQDLIPGTTAAVVPIQDLERARLGAEKARMLAVAPFMTAREAALNKQRDQRLAQAQAQIAVDQQRIQDVQKAARFAQQKSDDLAYQQGLDLGQKLMGQKKYADALASFQTARRFKQTPLVNQLINLAMQRQTDLNGQTAKSDEKKGTEPVVPIAKTGDDKKKAEALDNRAIAKASFQKSMTAGQKALAAKQYISAIAAFTEALKLMPDDPQARQSLQLAQRSYEEARQQAADAAKKQAQFQGFLKTGNAAMFAKRYADAVKAYQSALTAMPKDMQAQRGLRDAQKALDAAKAAAEATKNFLDAMKKAATLQNQFKYADAAAAYQEALKIRPRDAEAQLGLRKSQYSLNMQQGQQYLARSMFIDAQREFESALRLFPNDPGALKLWQKAKNKMK